MRMRLICSAAVIAAVVLAGGAALVPAAGASASSSDAASLAAANHLKTAGTCAENPTHNSLGGSEFATSCGSGGTHGEYWCADFARWVWGQVGFTTTSLSAAAASFDSFGQRYGTVRATPSVGSAITFRVSPSAGVHHVAIITAVNKDGSITTMNGDWAGSGSGEHFAETSHVAEITISARSHWAGSYSSGHHQYIAEIIAPTHSHNPYDPRSVCGSGYEVIDSHVLTDARIALLYNAGHNCVVTLAYADDGKQSMNATLAVQGGSSGSDPGSYDWYAGPVRESAPSACVKWGGQYKSSSWTSDWSHCG